MLTEQMLTPVIPIKMWSVPASQPLSTIPPTHEPGAVLVPESLEWSFTPSPAAAPRSPQQSRSRSRTVAGLSPEVPSEHSPVRGSRPATKVGRQALPRPSVQPRALEGWLGNGATVQPDSAQPSSSWEPFHGGVDLHQPRVQATFKVPPLQGTSGQHSRALHAEQTRTNIPRLGFRMS